MKITKYEHSCLVVEELGQIVVIDPGVFSKSIPSELKNVAAAVVTHMHGDHLDKGRIQTIINMNPDAIIFAPQEVLDELTSIQATKVEAEPGKVHTAGSFELDFYGHDHAVIYEKVPCVNVGVMVNKTLYYPGDSFTKPEQAVSVLTLPSGAPWMKLSEAIDFLKQVKPKVVFPTHNAVYSEGGLHIANSVLAPHAESAGADYKVLETGVSLDI